VEHLSPHIHPLYELNLLGDDCPTASTSRGPHCCSLHQIRNGETVRKYSTVPAMIPIQIPGASAAGAVILIIDLIRRQTRTKVFLSPAATRPCRRHQTANVGFATSASL